MDDTKGWRDEALAWVGRRVRITEGPSTENGSYEVGTVICIDATDYRPSAWVKVGDRREGRPSYPQYRSCDLCWLEDIETADAGQVWCSSPNESGHGELDGLVISERIRSVASVDTLPKGQDAQQGLAGTEGSAVAESETPRSNTHD